MPARSATIFPHGNGLNSERYWVDAPTSSVGTISPACLDCCGSLSRPGSFMSEACR